MKKRILSVLLAAAMILGVTCAMPVMAEEEGPRDMTFVVVPKCVHAWFDEVNKGAQQQADLLSEQLGVTISIDYRAPSTADVTEQNSVMEQAAATHPDGIAIDPVDYDGSKAVIEEIEDMGIPVILFDSPAPDGSNLTSVGNDFTVQAQLAAEALAEAIGYEGKVAVMQGSPSAPNHVERYEAHLATLAQYPDIEVIEGGIDNDNIETAQQQAAATIAANPDLVGFLNCDACGSGIAAAIDEAGKAGEITFVSMDSLIEILDYIPDVIMATSSTLPQMQGSYSVLLLWEAANGMDIPETVDTGIAYIDASNVDEWKEIVGE